tara:strand:+ start:5058 stop:5468 length:411 start_codon:yes stop_codon:yes gene_type:complete
MGFLIELSFHINKVSNFLRIKETIMALSEKHYKIFSYNNHEIMGKNRTIFRNHYVMTFLFEEKEEEVASFIRAIKLIKHVNIESVSYDNCVLKMMYASKKYLNIMEKGKAKEYLENKRNNTLFKSDSVIIKEIYKK